LALAVTSRPQLLLLDDPTAGLDPLVRREILQGILEGLSDEGGAVVYASHLVNDIERVADRVLVLDGGRPLLESALDDLKGRIRRARAVFEGDPPPATGIEGVIDCQVEGRVLQVTAESGAEELNAGLRGLGATEIETESLPLDEILVAYLRRGGVEETEHA